jgi:hypothetical protein
MNKRRVISFSVVLAGLIVGLVAVAPEGKGPSPEQDRTAKNSEHFQYLDSGRPMEAMAPDPDGVIDLFGNDRVHQYPGRATTDTPEKEMHSLARVADAVIEGVTEQRSSALTANHLAVFTEWTIRVTRIFKYTDKTEIP